MDIPKILESTKPVLYQTGYDDWPYAYAGSCFPVRWKKNLYIASAFHCYENHDVRPENTLYPIPNKEDKFFGFCSTLRLKASVANDEKHHDQILLQVSPKLYSSDELKSVKAIDLSIPESIVNLSSEEVKDVWLRGYLSENPSHEISYEKRKISQQAFVTNGIVSARKSTFNYCHLLKVETPTPDGYSPDGMSGSPVYAIDKLGNTRLAGVVIEFNIYTEEYLVIDPLVIREILRKENDT